MIQRMALAAFMLVLMASALAQDAKPDSTKLRWDDQRLSYKLEFVLKQLDKGKVVSTHKYLMSALSHVGNAEIRTGNRVPVDLGGDKGINYIDIGLNLDATATIARPTTLGLDIHWELSTVPEGASQDKLIRQVRVRSMPTVEFGKQVVVSTVDDMNSGQQFELDVTATPEPIS